MYYAGWIETTSVSNVDTPHQLMLCRVSNEMNQFSFVITIANDFSWTLQLHGHTIEAHASSVLGAAPQRLMSADLVLQLVCQLDLCSMCPGNPDDKFLPLASSKKEIFKSQSGKCTLLLHVCVWEH